MILVSGGTGSIGGIVAGHLRSSGLDVLLLVREKQTAESLRKDGWKVVVGDLTQPDSLPDAFSGVDQLFLSSNASDQMVAMQSNALEAACNAGVKKIVKLSSRGADESSPVELLRDHGQIEVKAQSLFSQFVFLRPTFMYQNLGSNLPRVLETGDLEAPLGNAPIAMLDARDLAAVAFVALTSGGLDGKGWLLTGPEGLTYADVASRIQSAFQREVRYVDATPQAFARQLQESGASPDVKRIVLGLFEDFKAGNEAIPQPTVEKILNRSPRKLDDYLSEQAAATRKSLAKPQLAGH